MVKKHHDLKHPQSRVKSACFDDLEAPLKVVLSFECPGFAFWVIFYFGPFSFGAFQGSFFLGFLVVL